MSINLSNFLRARAAANAPVRVGVIGAGKFGAMYLTQARSTPGIHVMGIADLDPRKAGETLRAAGWEEEAFSAQSFEEAAKKGTTRIVGDSMDLIKTSEHIDVIVECTGAPRAGLVHADAAIENGRNVIMATVEGDAVAGPWLAAKAKAAGVVYSMAWGDQPSIICEHVDWARTCGFEIACAGKGTRYHPDFHKSTPDTVWDNYILGNVDWKERGANPKMFNSFIDGSKSSIEMTAVCNATGLTPQPDGLQFPPSSVYDISEICKPKSHGGQVTHMGTTEVISSINRDKSPIDHNLVIGTYVTVRAQSEYGRRCIEEYGFLPDTTCEFSTMYRPTHLIGMELGVSVAHVVARNEPTGVAVDFISDVVAVAKRDLCVGEELDGEGGFCVWGKQMPAKQSLGVRALPLGLAEDIKLKRPVAEGAVVTWDDVDYSESDPCIAMRKNMEATF